MRRRLIVCGVLVRLLGAQEAPANQDLGKLNLEQIMDLRVSSVQRREQKLGKSAAAVYVITQDDIRRSGFTSLPEVLRLAPGLHVARIDTRNWAIAARGFNGTASNKLLVLIDGRTVYTPMYGGVLWDAQDVLLEDIDRIEIIRGPGATMWGANAVNGVINIITKSAARTQGSLVTAGAGREDQSINRFRHGGKLGRQTFYRVYSQYQRRSPLDTFSGPRDQPWSMVQGGFRIDGARSEDEAFTMQGDVYRGWGDIITGEVFPQPPFFTQARTLYDDTGGNLLFRWRRQLANGSEMTLQSYYDRADRKYWVGYSTNTGDVDFQHRIPLAPRFDLLWGAGFREVCDDTRSFSGGARFDPASDCYHIVSGTLQGEWQPVPDQVQITLGARAEHTAFSGANLQPTARFLWTPTHRHALWGAVSEAVRTPSRMERSLDGLVNFYADASTGVTTLTQLRGNPDLGVEKVRAYEAGYRWQPNRRLSLDLAAFYNRYRNLQSREVLGPPVPVGPLSQRVFSMTLTAGNQLYGRTAGWEGAAEIEVVKRWRLDPVYSSLWIRLWREGAPGQPGGFGNTALTPVHQFQLRSNLDLTRALELDTQWFGASRIPGWTYPSFQRVDLRLGWRVSELGEVSAGVQNLLDRRYLEYRPDDNRPLSVARRSFYLRLTWRF